MIDAATVEPMPAPGIYQDFWAQRPELTHVFNFARARRVSPFAMLGVVLRRVTACVEPHVVLPAIIGSVGSLNLFTVSVGASGLGKSAVEAAGADAVNLVDHDGTKLQIVEPNIGSGEGLARIFKGHDDELLTKVTRAHVFVPDVGTLTALAGRQGATLAPQLLAAFMGESLGFTNNSKATSTSIPKHSYRLCLSVGVQPENAGFFMEREADGFPQRFLWFGLVDPDAPDERPAEVPPLTVTLPHFPPPNLDEPWRRHELRVPASVRAEIDGPRTRRLQGKDGGDPLDAHLPFTQLKVAASLALFAGRAGLDDDDWRIAGQLVDLSKQVRAGVRAELVERRNRQNRAKALEEADRAKVMREREATDEFKRTKGAILRKLGRVEAGTATRNDLVKACAVCLRGYFDAALSALIDGGDVIEVSGGRADRYRLGNNEGAGQ